MSKNDEGAAPAPNGKSVSKAQVKETKTAQLEQVERLSELMKFYHQKHQLMQDRHRLQAKLDEARAIEVKEPESLVETEEYSGLEITLSKGSRSPVFKVKNQAFIADFVEFFIAKCEARLQELDKQILL